MRSSGTPQSENYPNFQVKNLTMFCKLAEFTHFGPPEENNKKLQQHLSQEPMTKI